MRNGKSLLIEIYRCLANVSIIAVVLAYALDEQRMVEMGFDGYMPMPINAHWLKAR